MASITQAFEEWLKKVDGRLYAFPLIPSLLTFLFSLVASVVINVSGQGACSHSLKAYIIGAIVLGYALTLYFGFVLVGPEASSLRVAAGYMLWILLTFCWTIFGTTAVSDADSNCRSQSYYKASLMLVIVYFIFLGAVFLPPIGVGLWTLLSKTSLFSKPKPAAAAS